MEEEMKSGKKYEKPVMRGMNDLTPALGLCASGTADGGCVPGASAGGVEGCNAGGFAGTKCVTGNVAQASCSGGTTVI